MCKIDRGSRPRHLWLMPPILLTGPPNRRPLPPQTAAANTGSAHLPPKQFGGRVWLHFKWIVAAFTALNPLGNNISFCAAAVNGPAASLLPPPPPTPMGVPVWLGCALAHLSYSKHVVNGMRTLLGKGAALASCEEFWTCTAARRDARCALPVPACFFCRDSASTPSPATRALPFFKRHLRVCLHSLKPSRSSQVGHRLRDWTVGSDRPA